jgi:acyl-CoA reductase-like NAD-dependent aldehyde dehydrogenase
MKAISHERLTIEHAREALLQRAKLDLGFFNLIDGRRLEAAEKVPVCDPSTGRELTTVPDIDRAGLDAAARAARKAFPTWSALTWADRRARIAEALEVLRDRVPELSALLALEGGRSSDIAEWEIRWVTDLFGPALLEMRLFEEESHEPGVGRIVKRHVPRGVIGAISPWNLPFMLSFVKALPALLVGNTVVLKPSPHTPLTVLRAADRIAAGLPAGVLNVVSGGDALGPWLTAHPEIDQISFTGSTQTGRKVLASGAATLKHVTLELGCNDAGIVLPGTDPRPFVEALFRAMFMLSGQTCIGLKRLYIHEDDYASFTRALVEYARTQRVGAGFDSSAALGPIQNRPQLARLEASWQQIQRSGAKVLYRGTTPSDAGGFFFPITLLDDPASDAPFVQQEQFGPIRSVMKYRTLDEAIGKANDSTYGLGGSVWGQDPLFLDTAARQLEAGTVWINQHMLTHPAVPFGGHKDSGRGVMYGLEGLRDLCDLRVIAARY